MSRSRSRRRLGASDMAVFDPSRPSRVIGFNWRNPWVIGGAAAAVGLVAWLAFGRKKKPAATKQVATSTPAALPPPSAVSGTRIRAASGDSWSSIARRNYGNEKWWPALWDANRSGGAKFRDPGLLRAGDEVELVNLPVNDAAFRAAVFARADAYRQWYVAGRRGGVPIVVMQATPVPVQSAPAGSQVSTQAAAAAASNTAPSQSVSASSSSPKPEDALRADAEAAWSSLEEQ